MTAALMNLLASPPQGAAPSGREIDRDVLALAQGGDRRALEAFIRHYEGSVFAFLSRVTGRGAHVEDLAQEVFLRAFRALPRYEQRPDARLSTWLLSIAWRLCLDHRKKRAVWLLPIEDAPMHAEGGPELERQKSRIIEAVERAAAELPAEQRAVFVLSEFHGLPPEEIAGLMKTGVTTVKTRLFRARRKLRKLLLPIWEEVR